MYIVKINPVEINVFSNDFVIIACGCKHVSSGELLNLLSYLLKDCMNLTNSFLQ
jgi:hypothetical protein